MPKKPMLAVSVEDLHQINFPVLASPKLDGVRATVQGGKLLTRSGELVPNLHVQAQFGRHRFEGLDGELTCGRITAEDVFRHTSSAVMTRGGTPVVQFNVFDWMDTTSVVDGCYDFEYRHTRAKKLILSHELQGMGIVCKLVPHKRLTSVAQLMQYEKEMLARGYEGVMLRDPDGLYKHGRSTLVEGGLLRMKRRENAEAKVVGVFEQLQNTNERTLGGKLGQTMKRSSHAAGMVAKGVLGGFQCVTDAGVAFNLGTGFTDAQRAELWAGGAARAAKRCVGKLVRYSYQPVGVKVAPRQPVFEGFRDKKDLS